MSAYCDFDEEFCALELSPLLLRRLSSQRHKKKRKMWVNPIYANRKEFGEFFNLWNELQNDDDNHFSYFGMTKATFCYILDKISSKLEKFSNFRETISPRERLAVTLRYLATGSSFKTLGYSFRISDVTVGRIVHETCTAIWDSLCDAHMAFPFDKDIDEISKEFWRKWKFPNCVGCINEKQIRMNSRQHFVLGGRAEKKPVLQGVVGPDYKFICIEVGSYENRSESRIFDLTNLYGELLRGAMKVHCDKQLPESDLRAPHVLIGDEGYRLKPFLMCPYPDISSGPDEDIFNKRLSLVKQSAEFAFGLISNNWRILLKTLDITAERANAIVKCVCLLHNIIIDREGLAEFQFNGNKNNYDSCSSRKISGGQNRSASRACEIRDIFKTYFVNNSIR